MSTLKQSMLEQLDSVLATFDRLPLEDRTSEYDFPMSCSHYASSAVATIERIVGQSDYRAIQARELASSVVAEEKLPRLQRIWKQLAGILVSIRNEVDAGYLVSTQILVHADMFSNLLEQAEYLLSEGYKDPAAVLSGGVLESHLRNLCDKNGISHIQADGKPKKASLMNDDLTKAKIYTALQNKEVTAWLGVRNSAAHGKFTEYDANQVKNMLAGVRGFITRHPA